MAALGADGVVVLRRRGSTIFLSVSCDYLLGRDDKEYLEVSGLSEQKINHIRLIIDDMRM